MLHAHFDIGPGRIGKVHVLKLDAALGLDRFFASGGVGVNVRFLRTVLRVDCAALNAGTLSMTLNKLAATPRAVVIRVICGPARPSKNALLMVENSTTNTLPRSISPFTISTPPYLQHCRSGSFSSNDMRTRRRARIQRGECRR